MIDFGDAVQMFHIGAVVVRRLRHAGGRRGGARSASRSLPLAELAAPAIALARDGVEVNRQQAYLWEMLAPIVEPRRGARALLPGGPVPREGDVLRDPELADAIERLAAEGAAPFYTRRHRRGGVRLGARRAAGTLTRADLAAYATVPRAPVRVAYRGREVLTNPPPSAGGILIAYALALLERGAGPPSRGARSCAAMEAAQAERTPEFLDGLAEPGFLERFMASRLGSTTHVSVLDADGWACAVTSHQRRGLGRRRCPAPASTSTT